MESISRRLLLYYSPCTLNLEALICPALVTIDLSNYYEKSHSQEVKGQQERRLITYF
jgi:hypothetical protein